MLTHLQMHVRISPLLQGFQAVCGTVSMLVITILYLILYGVTSSDAIL